METHPSGKAAAISSIVAAIFLTGMKIVVGILSGSLGILAEAAHSALDLVAAIVTFFAVSSSRKPADAEHRYGHGKVENLSALIEVGLLLLTCGWVIHEAIMRLITGKVEIDASIWAFGVMIVSMIIDINRSKMLHKAADENRSAALEADALHFSTDVWTSAAVIVGLVGVKLAEFFPALSFLHFSDAIAALVIAVLIIWVSLKMGVETIQGLMDAAPKGMTEKVDAAVRKIDGIIDCHSIRIRQSGPQYFADLHIVLEGTLSLSDTYVMIRRVENAIKEILPEADVTVRPQPRVKPEIK